MDINEIVQGLRDEYDSKPEWFKAIASALPLTGQLAALHEYDKAMSAGKGQDAILAAIGGLPMVGMATKGAVLAKGAKGAAQIAERDSSVIARGISNLGFGAGLGQSSAMTAQEQLKNLKLNAADSLAEQDAFYRASGGEQI